MFNNEAEFSWGNGWGSDDEFGGTFEESIAALGKKESRLLQVQFEALEDRLYQETLPMPQEEPEVMKSDFNSYDIDDPRYHEQMYQRFDGIGYDAHFKEVDDKELALWQNTFGPFLRIVGRQIDSIVDKEEENAQIFLKEYTRNDGTDNRIDAEAPIVAMAIGSTNNLEENEDDDPTLSSSLGCDLVVIGKAIPIYNRDDVPGAREIDDEEGIIDSYDPDTTLIDGILEEIIEIDSSDSNVFSKKSTKSSSSEDPRSEIRHTPPVTPKLVHQEELLALHVKEIWPDIVDALKPLVHRTITLSRSISDEANA